MIMIPLTIFDEQVMRRAKQMFVNLEQNEHDPMDYHAQTTYATNQMIHAKTQPPIAFHQMTHVQQINALSFLVGVNS